MAAWISEDFRGWPILHDLTLLHENDAVGDISCKPHFVSDDQEGGAVVRDALHRVQHLLHELGIKRGRDLVQENQLGIHGKRARNRNTLLLSARELTG